MTDTPVTPITDTPITETPITETTESFLLVTQTRSAIGTKPKHRGTLRALGLRGVGRKRVLPDRPEVRGMIARVPHLVEVGPASKEQAGVQREAQTKARQARQARGGGSLR
jgi:large subunit ribosomal protein L30